ncbi:cobalamin-binding protein [Elongatibacter sediminis]|uniref:Cobalamin-binding protein n=1 Tax=Elongatibacter sediminis TaxID=3119006 RepID=A0AAW9RBM2_9GAMM
MSRYPERIVCLTEETTETLYLLGEERRIVGISGFTVRPPRARREKPRVSAFTSAKIDRILALEPDLVLGFSDLQADIAAELIRNGVEVHVFNHRSVEQILNMMVQLASLVGAGDRMLEWVGVWEHEARALREDLPPVDRRPVVYFEEWDDPIITGIRWVSELVELAGGRDCFADNALQPLGRDRIVADPLEVVRRAPDIIIGSWCGKKFRPERVSARPGWEAVPAVRAGQVFEVKSALILQPGPAALTDGLKALRRIISNWPGRG